MEWAPSRTFCQQSWEQDGQQQASQLPRGDETMSLYPPRHLTNSVREEDAELLDSRTLGKLSSYIDLPTRLG
jgi:hypothetical protein